MWVRPILLLLAVLTVAPVRDAAAQDGRGPIAASVESCFVPGCDATGFVVAAIDGARREVRVQAYGFTSAPIAAALVRAKARGVDVAVLLDKTSPCGRGSRVDELAVAGIPLSIDWRPRIAHNKVIVIDADLPTDGRVIEGSFNFTAGAMKNAENTNLIAAPALARAYRAQWQRRAAASRPYEARAAWCRPRPRRERAGAGS